MIPFLKFSLLLLAAIMIYHGLLVLVVGLAVPPAEASGALTEQLTAWSAAEHVQDPHWSYEDQFIRNLIRLMVGFERTKREWAAFWSAPATAQLLEDVIKPNLRVKLPVNSKTVETVLDFMSTLHENEETFQFMLDGGKTGWFNNPRTDVNHISAAVKLINGGDDEKPIAENDATYLTAFHLWVDHWFHEAKKRCDENEDDCGELIENIGRSSMTRAIALHLLSDAGPAEIAKLFRISYEDVIESVLDQMKSLGGIATIYKSLVRFNRSRYSNIHEEFDLPNFLDIAVRSGNCLKGKAYITDLSTAITGIEHGRGPAIKDDLWCALNMDDDWVQQRNLLIDTLGSLDHKFAALVEYIETLSSEDRKWFLSYPDNQQLLVSDPVENAFIRVLAIGPVDSKPTLEKFGAILSFCAANGCLDDASAQLMEWVQLYTRDCTQDESHSNAACAELRGWGELNPMSASVIYQIMDPSDYWALFAAEDRETSDRKLQFMAESANKTVVDYQRFASVWFDDKDIRLINAIIANDTV